MISSSNRLTHAKSTSFLAILIFSVLFSISGHKNQDKQYVADYSSAPQCIYFMWNVLYVDAWVHAFGGKEEEMLQSLNDNMWT